jgi:DegV family protein with EDD domain
VRRVAVITDSSTCLPARLVETLSIRVLPISVHLDQLDATLDTGGGAGAPLSAAVEEEELTGANRPFVTEYLAAIEAPGYEAAVVVTPAIEFASMYRNASLASELATRPAVAIDTRTAAAGQALVVLAGAEIAAAGGDLEAVVRAIEDAIRRVELVASLATLAPIRRSGPVPDAVLGERELAGGRSVFRMRDGTVEPYGETGDAEHALETMRDIYAASAARGVVRSTVFHAGAPELASLLEAMLGRVDFVSGFSPAMQVHTGPGVVGAAWLPGPASAGRP